MRSLAYPSMVRTRDEEGLATKKARGRSSGERRMRMVVVSTGRPRREEGSRCRRSARGRRGAGLPRRRNYLIFIDEDTIVYQSPKYSFN
jgi:hypothetical protein